MELVVQRWEKPRMIAVPEQYQDPPRLAVWYRHGFSKAWRGLPVTMKLLRRLVQDKPAAEAYRAGYRAGEASRE